MFERSNYYPITFRDFTINTEDFPGLRVGFPFATRAYGVTVGTPPFVRPPCG